MNTAAALANGALEGALLTAIVWLALRAVPRRALNAATRYALWWATLAVVLTLPALHMPLPRWSRGTSVSADAAPWLAPSVWRHSYHSFTTAGRGSPRTRTGAPRKSLRSPAGR